MKNALPLVSIITPTYNRADYLEETIQSVISQDYANIEYIVLDDGSTDHTRDLLSRYTRQFYWETHANMGEHRTVNKGLGMMRGEIFAIVNSDDPLLPGAIRESVAYMQAHPEVLVTYPDWYVIDADSRITGETRLPEYDYVYMLRHHFCSVGPAAFVRRKALELIGMRDPQFKYIADFDYWLRLGLHGPFARIPKFLATYRVHSGAITSESWSTDRAAEYIRLFRKLYDQPNLPLDVAHIRREVFGRLYLGISKAGGLDREVARRYYLTGLLYCPSLLWEEKGWKHALTYRLPRLPYILFFVGWKTVVDFLRKEAVAKKTL